MIAISKQTEQFSNMLWETAGQEAHFYPVDRFFLEGYLNQITALPPSEFIKYNLEQFPNLYTTQLLVCLPELWEELTADDVVEIIENLTNLQAYLGLILFTYKYLQIDILPLIFNSPQVAPAFKKKIKTFLKKQYFNLILQADEREDFEDDGLGIALTDWIYVRQKLLLDERVRLAKEDVAALRAEVEGI